MSHRWEKIVVDEDQVRDDDGSGDSCGRQWTPVMIEMPEGSVLFFSALVHGGYGIWSLDEALIRPTPSMDDMMHTRIMDLFIRYQAHIARPKVGRDVKSIDPTKTVRGDDRPKEASYFHFNHRTPLVLLFPPVFTIVDKWLKEELVYDRSRFLDDVELLLPAEKEEQSEIEVARAAAKPSKNLADQKPTPKVSVPQAAPKPPKPAKENKRKGTSSTTQSAREKPEKRPRGEGKMEYAFSQADVQLVDEKDMDLCVFQYDWEAREAHLDEFFALCRCLPEWFDPLENRPYPDGEIVLQRYYLCGEKEKKTRCT
jgi:hypothetical protein